MHEQPVTANPGRHIPVQIGASARPSMQASYAERLQLQSLVQRSVDVIFGAKAAEEAGWELPDLDSIVDVRPRETCDYFILHCRSVHFHNCVNRVRSSACCCYPLSPS